MSLILIFMLACNIPSTPRELAKPTFSGEEVLGLGEVAPQTARSTDPFGNVEDDAEYEDDEASAEMIVALGNSLVSVLPDDSFDGTWEWSWSKSSGKTVFVHQNVDNQTDVIIYASEDTFTDPTVSSRAFLSGTVPALKLPGNWMIQSMLSASLSSLSMTGSPPLQTMQNLGSFMLPSMGVGLGFAPKNDRFPGWIWVGENRKDLYLRVSKLQGKFHQIEGSDIGLSLTSVLQDAVASGDISELLNARTEVQTLLYESSPSIPATMYVGQAKGEAQSVHFAIICTYGCDNAKSLAHFLDNIRIPESGEIASATATYDSLSEMGRFGLPLADIEPSDISFLKNTTQNYLKEWNAGNTDLIHQAAEGLGLSEDILQKATETLSGEEGSKEVLDALDGAEEEEPKEPLEIP
ncbi:MAG: hypothetical protein VX278_17660 [Myxococcota bacterium]|nr:hypothetical protein [Myxococcota bacterium]